MMRAQYFVYTRNYSNDYKSIIVPSEDFCPKEVRKFFLNQARGLINVEQYDDPLDNPRWLFSRKDSLILFGLGTNNNALDEECYKDYAGRPVRGFFGVIIDSLTEDVKIPYDINFYKDLYTNHILPIWNQDREQFVGHTIELDVDVNAYHCIEKNENSTQLNFDSRKSVILGDVGIEECISNALFFPGDISVAIGFSDKNHAFAAEYA